MRQASLKRELWQRLGIDPFLCYIAPVGMRRSSVVLDGSEVTRIKGEYVHFRPGMDRLTE